MRNYFRWGSVVLMLLGATVALRANADSTGTLTVELNGLRNRKGQVCLSLFANDRGFPQESKNAVQNRCVPVTAAPLQVTFENLKAGDYAVALLHDENLDGKMNRGLFGIPKEGFGFSRNPAIRFSAPEFSNSKVLVSGSSTKIQIRLKYF